MPDQLPTILALDFDGVLCDGLIEYFQTAWRAYCELWNPADRTLPPGLAEAFYRLRPVVESGWEMPVLVRALSLGTPDADILTHWTTLAPQLAQTTDKTAAEVGAMVDRLRDDWIATDLEDWLAQHRFYPGVVERLQQTLASDTYPVIVTTKEQRFVDLLLRQAGVELPRTQIFGKELRQPKAQTLRSLIHDFQAHGPVTVWFIEDRLKTLQAIQTQADLAQVTLYLADWGYNTATDRAIAQQDPTLHVISLAEFAQDFQDWP